MTLPEPPILLITDRHQADSALRQIVAAALEGGCRWISLREKDLGTDERTALAGEILEIAAPYEATILVHADVETARRVGLAGVHLPSGADARAARHALGAGALIGRSAHRTSEIATAAEEGVDYVTLSPTFTSPGKPGYGPALRQGGLRSATAAAPLPVVALGGITPGNTPVCRRAGAAGIAVMGGVMAASSPGDAMRRYCAAWSSV